MCCPVFSSRWACRGDGDPRRRQQQEQRERGRELEPSERRQPQPGGLVLSVQWLLWWKRGWVWGLARFSSGRWREPDFFVFPGHLKVLRKGPVTRLNWGFFYFILVKWSVVFLSIFSTKGIKFLPMHFHSHILCFDAAIDCVRAPSRCV